VLIKNFILPLDLRDPVGSAKRIETRIMLRLDNAWHGFTYEWNEDETDAVLLTGSKTRPFTITGTDGRTFAYDWFYPSRTDCFTCHTPAANFVLGLSTPQMNSVYTYPASGIRANQLSTLEYLSIFDAPLPAPVEQLSAMPDPFEPAAASTALRARAYLEANCAMCHQPGGPVPGGIMDLRWETSTAGTNTVGVAPIFGHIGIPNGLIIAPAEPDRSILPARMAHPGPPRMPPLASSRIDTEGLALIREWIATMNVPTAHGWHVH
jgi:mono/diheme cytochrome c family protein